MATTFCTVASNTEIVSCHISGTWNFEVANRFLENMCTPGLIFHKEVNISTQRLLGRSNCIFPSRFPTKLGMHSDACYMTCTPYSPSFSHVTNTWCNIQFIELLVMQCSPSFYDFLAVVPHIFSVVCSDNVECTFFPYSKRQASHPRRPGGGIIVFYILVFTFSRDGVLSLCGSALQI